MRLGWLFNNFADPGLRLSAEQRREADRLVHRRHLRGRLWVYTVFVVAPPVLAGLWATGLIDDWVGGLLGVSVPLASLTLIGLVIGASWVWSAWAYGRLYTRPYRAALRDAGVRICVRCGYPLDGLPPPATCPECGREEPDDAAARGGGGDGLAG